MSDNEINSVSANDLSIGVSTFQHFICKVRLREERRNLEYQR